jgi:hypothetical protein
MKNSEPFRSNRSWILEKKTCARRKILVCFFLWNIRSARGKNVLKFSPAKNRNLIFHSWKFCDNYDKIGVHIFFFEKCCFLRLWESKYWKSWQKPCFSPFSNFVKSAKIHKNNNFQTNKNTRPNLIEIVKGKTFSSIDPFMWKKKVKTSIFHLKNWFWEKQKTKLNFVFLK